MALDFPLSYPFFAPQIAVPSPARPGAQRLRHNCAVVLTTRQIRAAFTRRAKLLPNLRKTCRAAATPQPNSAHLQPPPPSASPPRAYRLVNLSWEEFGKRWNSLPAPVAQLDRAAAF